MGSNQQVLLLAISQVYSLWCYIPILRLYQTRFPFLPLNTWLSSSKRCIWCGELPTVETVLIKRSMRGTSWNKVFGHLPLNLGTHSTFKLCRSVRPLFAFLLHLATHLPFFPLKFHQTSSAKKTQTQLQLTPNHPSWFIQLPSIQPSLPPSVDWLANSMAHPTPKKSSFPWHCHTSIFSGLTPHFKVHPSWQVCNNHVKQPTYPISPFAGVTLAYPHLFLDDPPFSIVKFHDVSTCLLVYTLQFLLLNPPPFLMVM